MKITSTSLRGVQLIETNCFWDGRGMFEESFNRDLYKSVGLPTEWPQDNISTNPKPWVIRGLHMQAHNPQGKFVRCLRGAILDVVVDPKTGGHMTVRLDHPKWGLYVPA